ncbi:MAG: beta-galactosidase [Thermoproteota archaeon]
MRIYNVKHRHYVRRAAPDYGAYHKGFHAGSEWLSESVVDYFSEKFEKVAEEVAEKMCAPRRDDPYLLGYFTDNELRWGPDWRSSKHLFDDYLALEKHAPGKRMLVQYLMEKYGSIGELNAKWGTGFSSFEDILNIYGPPWILTGWASWSLFRKGISRFATTL